MAFFDNGGSPTAAGSPPAGPVFPNPPSNMIGRLAPVQLELVRGPEVAIDLLGFVCYPSGLEFSIHIRSRDGLIGPELLWTSADEASRKRNEHLHIGVEFSDGTVVTNLNGLFPLDVLPANTPLLMPQKGGGNRWTWSENVWLSPLPPPGTTRFVTEWLMAGIDEVTVAFEADPLLEASRHVVEFWPGPKRESIPPSVWTSMELRQLPDDRF